MHANIFIKILYANQKEKPKNKMFSKNTADTDKILNVKPKIKFKTIIPEQYWDYLNVFDGNETNQLPPIGGEKINHEIELLEEEKNQRSFGGRYTACQITNFWYLFRKTLTEYLDKNFIRINNSPAATPIFFVKKPGGSLRFYVDYRNFNRITIKDKYPLPLIYETFRNIGKTKWYIKLDVRTVFHRIKITEKNEGMTAYKTKYGLFEWLVIPFGLANVYNIFQKYINWALKDFLDKFCSAYIDDIDILIYTDGSRTNTRNK